jgi:putative FmdB family regulatory protein
MPTYVYKCDSGHSFEKLLSMSAPAPECPTCGSATHKVPAGMSLGHGSAITPPRRSSPSKSSTSSLWREAFAGRPDKVQRELEFRRRMEASAVGSQNGDAPGTGSSHGPSPETPPPSSINL